MASARRKCELWTGGPVTDCSTTASALEPPPVDMVRRRARISARKRLAVHGGDWRTRAAAMAISLWVLAAGPATAGHGGELAQNASDPDRAATEPSQSPVAEAPAAAVPANTPDQIRKAQIELRRLDCLKGRIDGKLGEQTRQAVKKFWASAKKPAVDVNITDALISDLAERGDNFCRPPRPFFAIGGGAGGNPALPPFAPGARPGAVPGAH